MITNKELEKFGECIEYIKLNHGNQVRRFSLAPYYTHPIKVACLVMKFKESHKIDELVTAALCHDLVEDTPVDIEEIISKYGEQVGSLVHELTSDKEGIKRLGKTQYLSDKLLKMSSWGLCIKLCDRLDNVMDFIYAPPTFVRKYALETKDLLNSLYHGYNLTDTHYSICRCIERTMSIYE